MFKQLDYKEIARYLTGGLGAFFVDCVFYFLFIGFWNPLLSKILSFCLGSSVAYATNKYWTFECPKRSWAEAGRYFLIVTLSLIANVAVNQLALMLTQQFVVSYLVAASFSTTVSYMGQKSWVFLQET